jgi:hypothetical protein
LGADIGRLTREQLERLVGLREDEDLEVKSQLYVGSDTERRELATDVAAFANGIGGLLLIGATTDDDRVTALTAVDCPDDVELRIRQILAELVVPFVEVEIQLLSESERVRFVLISVAPSQSAPHAVRVGSTLRYFIRSGPRRRSLSEPEIAALYRRRFDTAASRADLLAELHKSRAVKLDADVAWLVVSAMPERPGRLRLTHKSLDEVKSWLRDVERNTPRNPQFSDQNATVGIQRLILFDLNTTLPSAVRWRYLELHTDGSATLALPVSGPLRGSLVKDLDGQLLAVEDESLCINVIVALMLLARHAERTGAFGYLSFLVDLRAARPLTLVHERQLSQQVLPGGRPSDEVLNVGYTFDVSSLSRPGPPLLSAAYLVLADLVAAFGLPAPLQLTDDGRFRTRHLRRGNVDALRPWCERFGIEFTEDHL